MANCAINHNLMTSVRTIGLISGTSMDGIDVAVADLRLDGEIVELVPVRHTEVPYPDDLRDRLLDALPPGACSAEELCRLDTLVGQAFGAAAAAMGEAELVASLGQTVYHWVEDGRCIGTLQLGQPAWIAEATGLPVVADLRARDVAAGGHGAPMASTLDELWLADQDRTAAALNIGGIANITVVTPDGPTLAYDTGPGNALLDLAVRRSSSGARHFDEGGALAGTGSPRTDLLERLLADPYYARAAPKSTGKEHFHGDYLDTALAGLPEPTEADLLATLVELTAVTIARECNAHGVRRVVASGGGVRNSTLMAALGRHLGSTEVVSSAELGLPDDAKEAYLSALLGFLTWHGLPANRPDATGAAGPRLLGSITPGAEPLRLPAPARTAVTRLRVGEPVNDVVGGSRARP